MNKTTDDKWIPAHWTFENKAVAERFNRHVREQLPWYDHLMNCIVLTGAHYIPRNGLVYDVGARPATSAALSRRTYSTARRP